MSEKPNDHLNFDDPYEISSFEDQIFNPEEEVKRSLGVLVYNGKKYAVGLRWLTSDDFDGNSLVQKRAKAMKADFYCLRSFVTQHGFGYLSKGHRINMPSAAAMAADILVGEWHAVFRAENGWHYVAVRSDTITPDGDLFFDNEEDVYNHFLDQADNYRWPKTYVPDSWKVERNDGEINLDRILENVSTTNLKPVTLDAVFSGTQNKLLVFSALGGFLALFLLSVFSQDLFKTIMPEPISVNPFSINISNILTPPPQEYVEPTEPEKPVVTIQEFFLPAPSKVINSCIQGFEDMSIAIPGWTTQIMRCRNQLVEALWAADGGSLDELRNYASLFPFGVSRIYTSNGGFVTTKPVDDVSTYGQPVTLLQREKIILMLYDRFADLGGLSVAEVRQKQNVNAVGEGQQLLTVADLPSFVVRLNTSIAPLFLKDHFNIPGLRFELIEWNAQSGIWLYQVQIYLKPEI